MFHLNCQCTQTSHIDISIDNDLYVCNVQNSVELFELNETERSERQKEDALLQTQVEKLKEALTAQMADREAVEAALKTQNGQLHTNEWNINNPNHV